MSNTAIKPRPAAKPQAPSAPEAPQAEVKPTEAPAPAAEAKPSKAGQNSAYAPDEVRAKLAERLLQMRADGWTRPAISAIIGFNDSQVWRGFNLKAHTTEMETWVKFIQEVDAGTHKPPTSGRKPKPEALQAKIDAAIAKLGDEAKTAAQYKKVVQETLELLTA